MAEGTQDHPSVAAEAPAPVGYVSLEPRPHTQPPDQSSIVEVTREQLDAMSVPDLVAFAWNYLGVRLDPSHPKSRLLYRLVGMSMDVQEY